MDFGNRNVVICFPGDPRLAIVWDEHGGWEQGPDDPIMLVMGTLTSDEKCEHLAARFGVDVAPLKAARDARIQTHKQNARTLAAAFKHGLTVRRTGDGALKLKRSAQHG